METDPESSEALNERAHVYTDNEENVIKRVSIENATFYMRTAPPCDH